MKIWILTEANRLRLRIGWALALRGAAVGGALGLFVSGGCGLTVRLFWASCGAWTLGLGMAALGLVCAVAGGVLALRACPTPDVCLSALDASQAAGGLLLCAELPGAEMWPLPEPHSALRVVWRGGGRATAALGLACAFCAAVVTLPERLFPKAGYERLAVGPLVEERLAVAARMESQRLVPPETAAVLTNELTRLEKAGDASDPARVMEALDHIDQSLQQTADEAVSALAGAREDLAATQALAEMLAAALEKGAAAPAMPLGEAREALAQVLSSARVPPDVASNLLAMASSAGGLSSADLRELAARLAREGALADGRLAEWEKLRLMDPSRLGACGSCTNGAACDAALARLLSEEGAMADAARGLVAMCTEPGNGGVSRGRGDAMLTWTDPSTREHASFKEQSLGAARLPGLERSHVRGLSAASPEVPPEAAGVAPGALGSGGRGLGVTPQAAVLPRHREAVKRFFDK